MTDYQEFIKSKHKRHVGSGIPCQASDMPDCLADWQKETTAWALRKGRAALFEDCGLGKTRQQLVFADVVRQETRKPALILAPLAVAGQTVSEGEKCNLDVHYCLEQASVQPGVNITNYERLRHFDPSKFGGIILDESSILKSFMGKTKIALIKAFEDTPYRLCCTATPSPNDLMELGNHSDFLGIMPSTEMLTRWFTNDFNEAGKYRLKGYAEKDFWAWVASWAVCLSTPADIGFDATGYILPELHTRRHMVKANEFIEGSGTLINIEKLNATTMHKELRATCKDRAALAAELAKTNDAAVIWCNTDYEADAIAEAMAGEDFQEVRGGMPLERKESILRDFAAGNLRVLLTKPSICGFGLNWQHCNHSITAGLSFSFETRYQLIRRIWRFGQKRPVFDDVIMSPKEHAMWKAVSDKEEMHAGLHKNLSGVMKNEIFNDRSNRELLGYTPDKNMTLPGWLYAKGA